MSHVVGPSLGVQVDAGHVPANCPEGPADRAGATEQLQQVGHFPWTAICSAGARTTYQVNALTWFFFQTTSSSLELVHREQPTYKCRHVKWGLSVSRSLTPARLSPWELAYVKQCAKRVCFTAFSADSPRVSPLPSRVIRSSVQETTR